LFIALEAKAMKKLVLGLTITLAVVSLNCAIMPLVNSGYVVTRDDRKIEFRDSRFVDGEKTIYVFDKYSTHTFMKRDLKEIHILFEDKDILFAK
jgi:hypothetical protein